MTGCPSPADASKYTYEPIQDVGNIRVFCTHPGVGSVVECSIQEVSFAASPVFEALSYVWGEPTSSHYLQVRLTSESTAPNTLRITRSLYNALRDLRDNDGQRCVWADAVCIDQSNATERESQLQMMDKIYSRAAKVVTYIGEGSSDEVKSAVGLATALRRYSERFPDWQFPPDGRLYDQQKMSELGFPVASDPSWAALADLMSRSWSSRV